MKHQKVLHFFRLFGFKSFRQLAVFSNNIFFYQQKESNGIRRWKLETGVEIGLVSPGVNDTLGQQICSAFKGLVRWRVHETTCGLYNKHIKIISDASRMVRVISQFAASH
jgi:hypothetical protein